MAQKVKNLPASAGDLGSIPGWGRSPGEGNGSPLQCSGLGNLMDRGAWWATIHSHKRVRHDLTTRTTNKGMRNLLFLCCGGPAEGPVSRSPIRVSEREKGRQRDSTAKTERESTSSNKGITWWQAGEVEDLTRGL